MKKIFILILIFLTPSIYAQVSNAPDQAFKLANYSSGGDERVGLVFKDLLVDLRQANNYVQEHAGLPELRMPRDMLRLIEQQAVLKPRLFQIANYIADHLDGLSFTYNLNEITLHAPIKYPYNLIAAGQNYRAHAEEMGGNASIDPDQDNPFFFSKSPRSTIIDPNEPFIMQPHHTTIDWEGEFSIVMGSETRYASLDTAMDHVFGFTITFDVSDRERQIPENGRYARDWFPGKSLDQGAPMGPFVVMKEFLPNYNELEITTRVNGQLMQNSDTSYLIHDVERLIRYASSVMRLWPGDVIATGTPEGVGRGRNPSIYLQPGDTVEIEVEGIGTLVTPIR
jgi:2-keto-4-pentenoate hydratase/2-oxohepta-3-ene-1,7-dioic acid hydratase in catechol pathway